MKGGEFAPQDNFLSHGNWYGTRGVLRMIKERDTPTAEGLQRLYQRVASSYDAALWGYALVGFQHRRYRRKAIEALRLL